MKGDVFKLTFPAKPDYILAVRLFVSAIAERQGFNIEDIEDIKVACAEACTVLLAACPETIDIHITIENGIQMVLIAAGQKGEIKQDEVSQLSQYLLEALVDECEFVKQNEITVEVRFIKKL